MILLQLSTLLFVAFDLDLSFDVHIKALKLFMFHLLFFCSFILHGYPQSQRAAAARVFWGLKAFFFSLSSSLSPSWIYFLMFLLLMGYDQRSCFAFLMTPIVHHWDNDWWPLTRTACLCWWLDELVAWQRWDLMFMILLFLLPVSRRLHISILKLISSPWRFFGAKRAWDDLADPLSQKDIEHLSDIFLRIEF